MSSAAWPKLFLAKHNRETGVSAPGMPGKHCAERKCLSHTYDWRAAPGSAANTHRIEAVYRPVTAREMASTHYSTEAHVVGYEVFDIETGEPIGRQPRVRKVALPWLREQRFDVRLGWFMADVDTPGHVPWTPELRAEFDALWKAAAGPLATCAVYLSPKGYRLMQPLAEPLPAEAGERALGHWLEQLVEAGVWANVREVRDWTRNMRTPHHVRDGALVVSPWQDWRRCTPLVAPHVPAEPIPRPSFRRGNPSKPRPVGTFDEVCPAGWEGVADAVGAAIRDHVTSDWRRCYLAVAGALVELGCPPEGVPAVVARAHLVDPQWAYLLGDRVQIAQDTVLRWSAGADVSRAQHLRRGWPKVADALDEVTATGSEASVLRQIRGVERRIVDVTDATSILRQEIRDAYGITLLAGPPGLGKTEAVLAHAKGLDAIDGRAKAGQRIALSAPTTRLAKEVEARAEAQGIKTLRVFGSISHRAEDGTYTCIHRDRALPLVEGGQSLERLFCAPEGQPQCERADACPARAGFVGDKNANLLLGPHELLGALARHVGTAGTIVVDEPPSLVDTTTFPVEDFAAALEHLDGFRQDYARRMAGAMHAVLAWARAATPGEIIDGPGALRAGAPTLPLELLPPGAPDDDEALADALLTLAQTAVGEGARTIAPPLILSAASHARRSVARAAELGRASAALLAVYRALQPPIDGLHPTRLRVLERNERRSVAFIGANEVAVDTLRRDAATVLLDAGAALLAPSVERIAGFRPRLVELDVADGAPVTRTILATGRGTRKALFTRGALDPDAVVPLLRAAFAWALEDDATDSLVVVSWLAVEAVAAHCAEDPAAPGLLRQAGVTAKVASEIRERLADVMSRWNKPLRTAHYHGLRGLDEFRDFDALATIGDPRPTLDVENGRCAWLELDADGRIDALAAAELEQAHGRLRLVHRAKPARALHIGAIVPAGWRGREVEVRRMAVGRPKKIASDLLTPAQMRERREAKGLSLRALSLRVGMSIGVLSGYETGRKTMTDDDARRLIEALEF